MYSRKIEDYKKRLRLTDRQREIIVGKVLGDGHLETANKGRTYKLKIEHSVAQKEYVDWLYQEFKEWVRTAPQIKRQKRDEKVNIKYWFNTFSHGSLRFYAQQFYRNRKKVVPRSIHKWLTPLSLAVWFMDDGSIKSSQHKARIINTQGYTKEEVEHLIDILWKKFRVRAKLRKQKEGYQIYLLSETIERFVGIVRPYIIPSMRYKLKGLD